MGTIIGGYCLFSSSSCSSCPTGKFLIEDSKVCKCSVLQGNNFDFLFVFPEQDDKSGNNRILTPVPTSRTIHPASGYITGQVTTTSSTLQNFYIVMSVKFSSLNDVKLFEIQRGNMFYSLYLTNSRIHARVNNTDTITLNGSIVTSVWTNIVVHFFTDSTSTNVRVRSNINGVSSDITMRVTNPQTLQITPYNAKILENGFNGGELGVVGYYPSWFGTNGDQYDIDTVVDFISSFNN